MVRVMSIARALLIASLTLLQVACASHRADGCAHPAKIVGTSSRESQEGWVIVREDKSVEDTAARIATSYHVRTQALTYLHGFSTFPVPKEPKFFCDKAVAEVHYANSLTARQ
jgi:hypothetical protein